MIRLQSSATPADQNVMLRNADRSLRNRMNSHASVNAAAAAFTLAWLFILLRSERSAFRSITFWSAGVALLWSLIMTLWIDWIDYGRSYRPVALALKRALPTGSRCIESRGLGEAQRAAFDYHAGVLPRRAAAARARDAPRCAGLLGQAHPAAED